MRRGRILALIALFNFAGAQWIVLQSIAWSAMLLKQTRATHLSEAVQKAFDGAHPCHLCKGIARAKDQTKTSVPIEISKIPLLHAPKQSFVTGFNASRGFAPVAPHSLARSHQPESPPPRTSLS